MKYSTTTSGSLSSSLLLPQSGNTQSPLPRIIYAQRDSIEIFDAATFKKSSATILVAQDNHQPLTDFIRNNDLYSITLVTVPLDGLYRNNHFDPATHDDIRALLSFCPHAALIYCITHKTGGGHPLLVHVGGDCFRQERGGLRSVLERTRDLSTGMLRKASMVFPDISALTGGKKGEFLVIDPGTEESVSGYLEDRTIFQLSSQVLPTGIRFLNWQKGFSVESATGILPPDSLSPDVYTGQLWDQYCQEWIMNQQVDPRLITCIPGRFGGSGLSSSVPTAAGVTTTGSQLVQHLVNENITVSRFLVEGCGGVGTNCIRMLVEDFDIPAGNITAIDSKAAACESVKKFGVHVINADANDFYEGLNENSVFDVWMNNGVGDTAGLAAVQNLLGSGIRIFMGGANNLFKVDELDPVLNMIAASGAYAYPDWATSAGGWVYAVLEQVNKCGGNSQGNASQVIRQRNIKMVNESLTGYTGGTDLWRKVEADSKATIDRCLAAQQQLTGEAFNIHNWSL